MRKRLMVSIVGAAIFSGSTVAAAAGPTVYGSLHVSIDRYENDATASAVANDQGFISSNFSRIGVKGDGDLDGGMKYLYQILVPLRVDDGSSGLGATLYDTFVGLDSQAGMLRVGRMDTPVKDLGGIFSLFSARVGDFRNIFGLGGTLNFDNRLSNAVRYDTPKLGPVTAAAFYSSSEAAAYSASNTDAGSVNVRYASGPFSVGVGYEKHTTADTEDETTMRVAGSFKFGDGFTVAAIYEKMSDLGGTTGADRDSFGVSGMYQFGSSAVKLQYVQADAVDNVSPENGGSMFTVGFDHSLSKTVTAYVVYAKVSNDSGAAFKTSGAGGHAETLAANTGGDQTGISTGLVVNF